jgi:steroid 5-alpha reductase family enzyme
MLGTAFWPRPRLSCHAYRRAVSISANTDERGASLTRARLLVRNLPRDLGALGIFAAFVAEPSTRDFALVNLFVQVVLFVLGACLFAHRTRVMAVVDCAWSWGLAAIGVQALLRGHPGSPVLLIVASIYIVMGARMGIHTLFITVTDFPRQDLPRYRYRRVLWRREGYRSETLPMLHDILMQGLGNASLLATPAMLAVADRNAPIGLCVLAGALLWAVSWPLESIADLQKTWFGRRYAGGGATRTCDLGLWRYSRHPNYFFQWLQWQGLVVVGLPSLISLAGRMAALPWVGFAAGLLSIPVGMYYVLVYFTGAVPAEHFSVQHRSDYCEYQRSVNRFFPGPNRCQRSPVSE